MDYFRGKNGVYIIAEIGGNHEGDFDYARKLTALAAESGADAIKFQVYTGDTLVNPLLDAERNQHFKKFELTREQYIELARICRSLGVNFLASVWDIHAIDYIDEFIAIYKIGSGDLTAYNLINKILQRGKPIILSTGLSTLREVVATVEFIKSIDATYIEQKKLALLQCTAMYPIFDQEANLNVMHTLRDETDLPVGYSDHTEGMEALEVAVAMGAEIIEKHFTDTREGKSFRDHKVSATKDAMLTFVEKVKKIKVLQGNSVKKPTESELLEGHVTSFRRGVYPARNVKAGEIIRVEDLITLRPQRGIGAESFYELIGKRARIDLIRHQELSMDYFEAG